MHAFDALGEGMMRRAMESNGSIDDYIAGEGEAADEKLQMLRWAS